MCFKQLVRMLLFVLLVISNGGRAAPPPYEYVGCFKDNFNRVFLFYLQVNSLTIAGCAQISISKGYNTGYFGVQNGNQCWWDNRLNPMQYGNSSGCIDPCSGNASEICGGGYINSLYKFIQPSSPSTTSPTNSPTTSYPTTSPTHSPTTGTPTNSPTNSPTTSTPTTSTTHSPTTSTPTNSPTNSPTSSKPTTSPSPPSFSPTSSPVINPISSPSWSPSQPHIPIACRPHNGLNFQKCKNRTRFCSQFGIKMKWNAVPCRSRKSVGRKHAKLLGGKKIRSGCQCDQYCGYSCPKACNSDSQCTWKNNQCYNVATGQPGQSFPICIPNV